MKSLFLLVLSLITTILFAQQGNLVTEPYHINTHLESRSISFENPTGEPGKGGTAASPLGVGRKGAPARPIAPGETVVLADIEGSGTIRHIWATTFEQPQILRGAIIRAYWDGQEHPSIEVPLGDFFGFAHGHTAAYESAIHAVGERKGMNIYLPMPFRSAAKVTLTNTLPTMIPLFYQIDYTIGDRHSEDVGRLHVMFRRENKTTTERDFEILPQRKGKGRYLGTVLGVRVEDTKWWGEGEVKIYLDGDTDFPTICGTGSEDYVGLSWGMQQTPFRYNGCSLNENGYISMYRWHLPDPIYWKEDIRVTVQQIGHKGTSMKPEDYFNQLENREDDWSTSTFWYEAIPSEKLPDLQPMQDLINDLYTTKK